MKNAAPVNRSDAENPMRRDSISCPFCSYEVAHSIDNGKDKDPDNVQKMPKKGHSINSGNAGS